MCIFTISCIFCGAGRPLASIPAVLLVGFFLRPKRGFHVTGCPGVPRARDVRGCAPFTSLRTPELWRDTLPEACGPHSMAPCTQLRGKKMGEKTDSKTQSSTLALSTWETWTDQLGWSGDHNIRNALTVCGVVVTLHGLPPTGLGTRELCSVLRAERRQVKTEQWCPSPRFHLLISAVLWQCHLGRTFPFPGLRLVGFVTHRNPALQRKVALTAVKGLQTAARVRLSSLSVSPSPSVRRSPLPTSAWIPLRGLSTRPQATTGRFQSLIPHTLERRDQHHIFPNSGFWKDKFVGRTGYKRQGGSTATS